MARHAEVKEKEIIDAALALEEKGKTPNPGSIRAQLGFRGGLARIRRVWEAYQDKQGGHADDDESQLTMDDLPAELSDAYNYLLAHQKKTLEALIVQAYSRCQSMFEKRLGEHISQHNQQMQYFKEYESSADDSIHRLEDELRTLQSELKDLADQNAKIILENADLKGRLAVFDERFNTSKFKTSNE